MATPASRILVVYIDTANATAAADDTSVNAPALDEVTKRGCSGVLILPEGRTGESNSALLALLGVDADAPNTDGQFPFPKMPIAFFSDSSAACDSAKALGIANVHTIACTAPQEPVAAQVDALLHPQDSKTKQLVVVHLSQYRADHWVFPLVEKLLGTEATASPNDCFVSVVRTAQRPHRIADDVAAHPLRPRQIYERHHGQYSDAHVLTAPRRLLVSSVHGDRTRCDLAMRFDEDEIDARGAYGAMDARVFMKELAFRLGFAPKYGA